MRARLYFAVLVGIVGVAFSINTAPASVSAAPAEQHTSTLDDQTELAVTVYNSDIALVRDVRNLQLPRGSFDLQLHGHRRDRESRRPCTSARSPSRRASSVARAELRVRPARARQAAAQVRRPRRHAGAQRAGGRARRSEEEVKARLLSYNNAPVWQIGNEIVTGLQRRSHPLPGAARQSLHAPDADLDARQRRRRAASRRGVVPRGQAVVERRLRADRRRATTRPPISTAGSRSPTAAARRSGTRSCSSSPAI